MLEWQDGEAGFGMVRDRCLFFLSPEERAGAAAALVAIFEQAMGEDAKPETLKQQQPAPATPPADPGVSASASGAVGPVNFTFSATGLWVLCVLLCGAIGWGLGTQEAIPGRTVLSVFSCFLLGLLGAFTFMARYMFPLFQTELDRLHAEVNRCGAEKSRLHELLLQGVASSTVKPRPEKPKGT